MNQALAAIGLSAGLLSTVDRPAVAAGNEGARLAAVCAPCHNPDGQDRGIAPIAGFEATRLVEMMKGFRSDESSNHIMHAVSLSLSDQELASIAGYLAAQGPKAERP